MIAPSRSARASIPTLTSRSNVNEASSSRPPTTFSTPAADRVRVAAVRDEGEPVASEREGPNVVLDRRLDDAARELEIALVEAAVEDDAATRRGTRPRRGRRAGRVQPPSPSSAPTICLRRSSLSGSTSAARSASAYPAASAISIGPDEKRCPYERSPTIRVELSIAQPPAHRPRKAQAAVVPAHRLREREAPRRAASTCSGSTSASGFPATATPRKPSRSSSSSTATPWRFAKPGRGLVPHRDRRPLHPLVRRLLRHVLREHGEPARRHEHPARLDSASTPRQLRQLPFRLAARRRGQLLAADLNQERRHRSPRRAGRSGARACGRARCRRPARSPTRRRARRAG